MTRKAANYSGAVTISRNGVIRKHTKLVWAVIILCGLHEISIDILT